MNSRKDTSRTGCISARKIDNRTSPLYQTSCRKAINCSDYTIFLSLFYMSKAFDTVNGHKRFEILEEIMTPDELHIMSLLTNLPKMKVKINN